MNALYSARTEFSSSAVGSVRCATVGLCPGEENGKNTLLDAAWKILL